MSWWTTLLGLANGVRIHPSATVNGPRGRFDFARGVSISRSCVLRVDGAGTVALGEGAWLARDCEIETETHVEIGARTTIQRRCTINGTTRIGADCIFAPDVFVSSGTHPFREIAHLPIREQERRLAKDGVSLDRAVWIQDDCWIGTHVVVAPGVTIGKGCVIGANSVVTKDVPPYSVAAGMPARVIGERLAWTPPARVDPQAEADRPYILSTHTSLLVALAPGVRIRASLRCTRAVRLQVNGQAVDASAQTTQIVVAPASGLPFGASLSIEWPHAQAGDVAFTAFESLAA